MKAIVVLYLEPTDTKGARYCAIAEGVKALLSPEQTEQDNYALAALKLCERMNWTGTLAQGTLPNGDKVFVWVDKHDLLIVKGEMK